MVEVRKYILPPTTRMPNSPYPLIHYPGLLAGHADQTPPNVYKTLTSNGWQPRWLVRYGKTQWSHYHSTVHECMVVLSGSAKIRFGVADIDPDDNEPDSATNQSTLERSMDPPSGREDGGIVLSAEVGDVFVLPAGLAHKTHDPTPEGTLKLLAPQDFHHVKDDELKNAMEQVELSGFTMLGAYPIDGDDWDFQIGGENKGEYDEVWSVQKPERDPVLGTSSEGICSTWS